MSFTKLHLSEIPIEEAHGGSGARQTLVRSEHLTTPYLEAITKGFLKSGKVFDWHNHKDTDEITIVIKGEGKFYVEKEITDYKEGNVFVVPADIMHKIEATSDTEFYFIRVRNK